MWAQRGIVWKGIRVFKQCEVGNTRSRKNTEVRQLGPRIAQLDGGDHSIGLDVDAGATNTVKSQKRRNGPLHYYWLLGQKKKTKGRLYLSEEEDVPGPGEGGEGGAGWWAALWRAGGLLVQAAPGAAPTALHQRGRIKASEKLLRAGQLLCKKEDNIVIGNAAEPEPN